MRDEERDLGEDEVRVIPLDTQTLLSTWGSRAEIREMTDRVRRSVSVNVGNGTKRPLSISEATVLTIACLPYGLTPGLDVIPILVKGEFALHYAPTCWLKAAVRLLKEEGGGSCWAEYRLLRDDERAQLRIPDGAVAYECRLYDTPTIRAYTELVRELNKLKDITTDQLLSIAGERPYTPGLGYWLPTEKRPADSLYSVHEAAQKRAHKQALKKRFPLQFVGNSAGHLPPEFSGRLLPEPGHEAVIDQKTKKEAQAPETPGAGGEPDFSDPAVVEASMRAEAERAAIQRDSEAVYGTRGA